MKKSMGFIALFLLLNYALCACGPSPAEQAATITHIAAGVIGTQTAQAPTIILTFTSSPTATNTPTPTATSTPTKTLFPTYEPGVIFKDDFSNLGSGWEHFHDDAGFNDYADGGYKIFINDLGYYFWDTRQISHMDDVIIDVDAQKIAGPDNGYYGVICRYINAGNYYVFLIRGDGYYEIWKIHQDEWVPISLSAYGFNDRVIHTGNSINHFRVTCNKDDLSLEVNGEVLMDVYDTDFASGEVGMFADVSDTAGLEILFDNFVVHLP
jgi:hypothetical protein